MAKLALSRAGDERESAIPTISVKRPQLGHCDKRQYSDPRRSHVAHKETLFLGTRRVITAHGSYRLLSTTAATAERLPQPGSVPQQQQGTPARTSAPYTTREDLPARTDGKGDSRRKRRAYTPGRARSSSERASKTESSKELAGGHLHFQSLIPLSFDFQFARRPRGFSSANVAWAEPSAT